MSTTRRGFIKGSALATLAGPVACRPELSAEAVATPSAPPLVPAERVKIRTRVNGRDHDLEVHPDDAALEVVRGQIGLKGAKHGCGHGACGACTMQLDGTPVATCILPATALHDRKVTTVEGLGKDGGLHPVQRAFMAEDALQCGYCTPGFVVEAAAFVDRVRADGDREPTRDEVAAALAGHLCRCGAYAAIYRAVQGACAGKFDAFGPDDAPRVDAHAKVTGQAIYTVDVDVPGLLVAKALHAPWAHAKVRRLDWSKALALPGVRGAVRLLGEGGMVRYAGQELLAIAAVDERTAERALELVEIDVEIREALVGIDAALAPGAPLVYPKRADRKSPPNASEGPLLPEKWEGNKRGPFELFSKAPGKAERAIEEAKSGGSVVEGKWSTQTQCHTALEPHAAVAVWDGPKRVTVYLSTQAVSAMAGDIAERWGLRDEDVRVIALYVGGGFGAKATLQTEAVVAIELAKICNAPVRYALDRRFEIMIGGNRPATRVDVALATDRAGELVGMTSDAVADCGVAVGHISSVMFRIIYPEAPRRLRDTDVVSHAPPSKPMRGPGGPPAFWALEQAIDELAHQRKEDPLALRRRWDPSPARKPLYAWAETIPRWRDRGPVAADQGRFRRGVGVACGAWFVFAEPRTRIQLDLRRGEQGGLVASTASQDIGNGTRTLVARSVARRFGLAPHEVGVRVGDSHYVHGPMAGGSRTTSSIVGPCDDACDQMAAELAEFASRRFKLRRAKPVVAGVEHERGTMPWRDVFAAAPEISVVGKRRRDEGGFFLPPILGLAVERYVAGSLQIAEVEVDTRLGRIRVLESWVGIGVGRIVAPELARSQAEGGVVQGIGFALYEERRLDPKAGFLLTGGLEDYRVPGLGDVGPIHVHFDEHGYEKVPGHNVGLGELVTLTPAAAIGNAVFHATGWRPRELPLRPDRVLKGLRG
jgi:xanthine dehydrogenase YagR molybdenum-binding subunit